MQTFEHDGVTYTVAPANQFQSYLMRGYLRDWITVIAKDKGVSDPLDSNTLLQLVDMFLSWHICVTPDDKKFKRLSLTVPSIKDFNAFVAMMESDDELWIKFKGALDTVLHGGDDDKSPL